MLILQVRHTVCMQRCLFIYKNGDNTYSYKILSNNAPIIHATKPCLFKSAEYLATLLYFVKVFLLVIYKNGDNTYSYTVFMLRCLFIYKKGDNTYSYKILSNNAPIIHATKRVFSNQLNT